MGLLMDIRSGKRFQTRGHAFVAWLIVGAGLGWLASGLVPELRHLLEAVGALAGTLIGLYAEWGTSTPARLLAVPAMVFGPIR